MATFKAIVFTGGKHVKQDGTANIKIRIYHNGSAHNTWLSFGQCAVKLWAYKSFFTIAFTPQWAFNLLKVKISHLVNIHR